MSRSKWALVAVVLVAAGGLPALAGGLEDAPQYITNIRQLTFEGRRTGECYFSPDGKQLTFMSEREPGNPFFQIYVLDFETGDVRRLSNGRGKTTCPFFQQGTGLIQYASTHLDADFEAKAKAEYKRRESGEQRRGSWDYDETYDIFLAQPDGKIVKRLTDAPGYDAEAGFSPDGKKIVFCSLRDAFPLDKLTAKQREEYDRDAAYFGEIYIMNADGSDQKRLTDWPGYDGGPFFTPDGKRIVWRHFTEDGMMADVYTMKPDGSDRRRLTEFKAMSWAPFFHPSMEYCIFVSNKLGFSNFELFIVDALGQHEPVQVTYRPGFDGLAVFSPDGKNIVWTSNSTDTQKSQLFMGSWDHAAALKALAQSPKRIPEKVGSAGK